MTEPIPAFLTEADIADVWRSVKVNEADERFSREHRHHAEQELLRRAAEAEATVLATPWEDISITLPTTYSYNSRVVDGEFQRLIERDGLTEQWDQFVQHSYRINRSWLNKLAKRGAEYKSVIEAMTNAGTGSPKMDGPSLAEIEEADAKADTII